MPMTEDEWNICSNPQAMLNFLREQGKLSERKARLFAVACCRRIWPLLTDERSRRAVEVAERYADGQAEIKELDTAREALTEGVDVTILLSGKGSHLMAVAWATQRAEIYNRDKLSWAKLSPVAFAEHVAAFAREAATQPGKGKTRSARAVVMESRAQTDLIRCLFGNSLRARLPFDVSLLTPEVVALGTTIYESRSFDRMPELADLLAAGGCTDAELLGHLRGPGPHAGKGCWALDAILGKG